MRVPAAAGKHLAIKACRTITEYRAEIAGFHAAGESVGLVPTMGGLHAGHMALVEQAKAENDRVVTTIFLNRTQCGDAALALANFLEGDFSECIKWGHLSYQRQSGLQLTMIAGHEARGICRQLCATMNCSTQSPRDFSKRWPTAAFNAAVWKGTRRHCGTDCEGSQKRLLQPEQKKAAITAA